MLLMTGSGQLDLFEMLFSFLKSLQNLLVPSFLSMTTIGKIQGDLGGHIIFAANISFTALSTIGCLAKGVLYGLSLKGGRLPVSLVILIVLVFTKSVSFSAKRSTFCFFKSSTVSLGLTGTIIFCFEVIKRTYLEGSLLFPLIQIINIYKVTFLHLFNFTNGASLSQPNKFISIGNKEHRKLTFFTFFCNRIDSVGQGLC